MKLAKRLAPYLSFQKGRVALSLFFASISTISKMAIPFLSGIAIQELANHDSSHLSLYLILMSVLLVLGSLSRYFFDFTLSLLASEIVKKMREKVYSSYNASSIFYIDSHGHGDLLQTLINDIENVKTGLIAGAAAVYEGVVQILVTLVFMFMINWLLAIMVIVLSPLSILVSKSISKYNSKYFKKQSKDSGKLNAFSLETISNLETGKSYGLDEEKGECFEKMNSELRYSSFHANMGNAWINPATRLVNYCIYAILCFFGTFMIITSWKNNLGLAGFGVGYLSSMLTYANQFMAPFNEISSVSSEISYAIASFRRIDEAISNPHDIDDGKKTLSGEVSQLEAEHINFSYDSSRQIITDFDLKVFQGHKIALVGPTGCGKTTIINLLLRFYDPSSGAFILNGEKATDLKKEEIRSHIGMVLQDTWLFKGSIKDNIAYGKQDASFEEIVKASKLAYADDFIRTLPKGYDTIVSNRTGLSTGQKQLICVARIMLKHPEIVVLDEATSNIDLRTELLLSKSFDSLMKGKTSFVVAHRLSTIKNADLIIVLKDGKMIEEGNFQQLMEKKGFFKELYDSQLA